MTDEGPFRFVATCYGRPVAEYGSEPEAKAALADHIWHCPEGPMPWARPIEWHRMDGTNPLTGSPAISPGWATSSHGEWLDHSIREEHRP